MKRDSLVLVYVFRTTSCFSFIIHWSVLQFVEVVTTMSLIYEKTMFLGLVLLVFFSLCMVVVGVGDGMRLMENGNKKPIFEKLSTQSTILFFLARFMFLH